MLEKYLKEQCYSKYCKQTFFKKIVKIIPNSKVIIKSIIDPDDNFKRTS